METLAAQLSDNPQDFHGEVTINRDAIFLHLLYSMRMRADGSILAVPKEDVLAAIRVVWTDASPKLSLPRAG